MLDTVLLCGNTDDFQDGTPSGPASSVLANHQLLWLQERMQSSTADFLLVAGHYPVWSVSKHGPTDCLLRRLRPLLVKYKATAYLCGHDHNLQVSLYNWKLLLGLKGLMVGRFPSVSKVLKVFVYGTLIWEVLHISTSLSAEDCTVLGTVLFVWNQWTANPRTVVAWWLRQWATDQQVVGKPINSKVLPCIMSKVLWKNQPNEVYVNCVPWMEHYYL